MYQIAIIFRFARLFYGGYMYGMKEMVHMSRVDMWGNVAGGL